MQAPLTIIWKSAFCLILFNLLLLEEVMSQPCYQADTSISIGTGPVAQPVGSLEDWIGISPDSAQIRITVSSRADSISGHVHRIVLYSGDCSNLVQISNDYLISEEDSVLVIHARWLTPGSSYLLKLEFETDTFLECSKCGIPAGTFDISIENLGKDFVIPVTTCFDPCPAQLIVNGDFEAGNAGFTSANTFQTCTQITQAPPPYVYGICTNASSMNPAGWSSSPHQGALAMYADVPENPNNTTFLSFYAQVIPVKPNETYCISFWYKNIAPNATILPNITVWITGNGSGVHPLVAQTGNISTDGIWRKLTFQWTSFINDTQITFSLLSIPSGSANSGNDVGIDDVSILGASAPATISASATTICTGQQITITAFTCSQTATYSWNTGATTNSIVVNPSTTTTYTCVINDGCLTYVRSVTINVIPSISFTTNPFPACSGQSIQFTNNTFTGNSPTTYSWNFGDPGSGTNNTSTLVNPTHLFSGPGSYQVTLTVNNQLCGAYTATQTVQLVPSTPTYNPNCCSSNQQLYTDNTISINSVPLQTTTWNAQNKVIQFNLEVLPGATLIIQNSLIQFGPTGKLIVHPQAKVIVDNATLRGLLSCGTMWMGVEVAGNSSKNQYQVDINGNIFHGKFILRNSSFIIDAHNGIISGRASGAFFNLTQSGGIIEATNSSFINCGISFRPVYYSYASASFIRECSFSSTTLPDPGYSTSGPYQYPINNPGFGYANPLQRTWAHIASANTRRIRFMDNVLANSEYGAYSVNSAHWYIDGNQDGDANSFSNMTQALRMDYYWSSIFANRIEDNDFENISGPLWIIANGGKGDVIKRNRFNFQGINQNQNVSAALVMANSSGFRIMDNQFVKMALGTWISSSGALGGVVGFENTGNIFDRCLIGERVVFNNPALQIRCNIHANTPSTYYLDWQVLNFNQGSSLANQGTFPAVTDRDPAGNEFNVNNINSQNEIWSDFALFNYLHHNPASLLSVVPGISFLNNQVLNAANLLGTSFLKGPNSCISVPCPPPCNQRVVLANNLYALEGELTSVTSSIDGGNTTLVLNTISSGMPSGQLHNFLSAHFPLSDQALVAYINLPGTPPGVFKQVILENSPVSNEVRSVLYNKLGNMPPGISLQIKDAQSGFINRTLTSIGREIESIRQQILFIDTDAMIYYAEQDSVSDAVSAIGAQNNFEASEVISATWLQEGNHANAASVLGSMTAVDPEEQDYLILQNMLLSLIQSGRSVFEMSAIEEQLVRTVAGRATPSLARTNARAILFYVFSEDFTDEFDMNLNLRVMAESKKETESNVNTGILGNAFPNPSDGSVTIPYFINNESGGLIRVIDTMGKEIHAISANPGWGAVVLTKGVLSSGVYYLELSSEGSRSPIQKLIVY